MRTYILATTAFIQPITQHEATSLCVNVCSQFDLPAMLSYIRETTGADRVHYVGHSQVRVRRMVSIE